MIFPAELIAPARATKPGLSAEEICGARVHVPGPGPRIRARHAGRLRHRQVPVRRVHSVGAGVRPRADAPAPFGLDWCAGPALATGSSRWAEENQRHAFCGHDNDTWDLPTTPGLRIGGQRPTAAADSAWSSGGSTLGGIPDWIDDRTRSPPAPRRSARFSPPQPISTRGRGAARRGEPQPDARRCRVHPVPRVPGRTGRLHDRAMCRGALLGAHGRPPLPAAGRSGRSPCTDRLSTGSNRFELERRKRGIEKVVAVVAKEDPDRAAEIIEGAEMGITRTLTCPVVNI